VYYAITKMKDQKSLTIILCFLLALVLYSASGCSSREGEQTAKSSPAPRGIILIIADALRADHLSCYRYHRQTSPYLDNLAGKGVLFTHAYSQCSWTTPSITSIFSSLYPSVHKVGHTKSNYGYLGRIHPNVVTLAEVMQQHGYRTYGLLNNPAVSANIGFDQGFDQYENNEFIPPDQPTQETYNKAIGYLKELKDDKFLFVWHIIDPHWPYYPPAKFKVFTDKAYRGRFQEGFISRQANPLVNGRMRLSAAEIKHIINLYDDEIGFTDYQIGKLLSAIKQLGLEKKVSLIFTSDHGESFLEHGHFGHEFPMYEENLQVPLIIYDHRFPPRTVSNIVESIDIMPTILDLANIPLPDGLQGKSLLALMEGTKSGWKDKPAYSEASQFIERKALRTLKSKLIWGVAGLTLNDDFISGQNEIPKVLAQEKKLYDYTNMGEEKDVSDQLAGQVTSLTKDIYRRMKTNEQLQLTGSSCFKSFYFLDDWRKAVHSIQGDISWENGVLKISDNPQAEIIWQVSFPEPIIKGQLQLIAYCDRKIPFFAVSQDKKEWVNISWPKAAKQGFAKTGMLLAPFAGSRTLYLKFFQTSAAQTYLRGFYLDVQFTETSMEVDKKTKERLKALGYL